MLAANSSFGLIFTNHPTSYLILYQRFRILKQKVSKNTDQLCSHIGFDLLATISVQVEGEEEKLSIGAMIHEP